MTKLKQVSKELKKLDALKEYKHMFKHRQMRFACSKTLLIFNPDATVKLLLSIEYSLLQEKKNSKMFANSMKKLKDNTEGNIDWKTFGEFLWYLFQTSTYYHDTEHDIKNIYSKENFIKINSKKRNAYQKWMDSIDRNDLHYNSKIMSILKELT